MRHKFKLWVDKHYDRIAFLCGIIAAFGAWFTSKTQWHFHWVGMYVAIITAFFLVVCWDFHVNGE